jgi:acetolactate synthase regulatory subunit
MTSSAQQVSDATFAITTEHCPQILCRLLGMIAQQGRLVERIEARRRPKYLHVHLSIAGMDAHSATIVAEKMRSLVPVRSVKLVAPAARD